jgi:pimeloyl-ACP methyl ester carboxylesterase
MSDASVQALRTPEERFRDVPDFDYPVSYVDDLPGYEGLQAAWIDAGPKTAERTFLCLHGEPSWSFLYRRMIPVFLASGARVVCPDLFGFGRSDKPTEPETYTFDFHRNHILALVARLNLDNVTLVVQDWGGLIGLTLPADDGFRPRLARLLVMNTTLGLGQSPGEGFNAWKDFALNTPVFKAGKIIAAGTPHLTAAEIAAYDAPYPDARYQAGARRFPALVPVSPDMEGVEVSTRAASFWKDEWRGDTFMAVGDADPVLGLPVMLQLQKMINGCPEPLVIEGGGHFVQEWGESIARSALARFGDL